MHSPSLVIVLAAPLALAHAQSPLSGLQHGLVFQEANTGTTSVVRKPAGDKPAVPFTAVDQSAPTFTIDALLHGHAEASTFKMNAVSTGNDLLPMEAGPPNQGGEVDHWRIKLDNPDLGWATIAMTVESGATHSSPGTVFSDRLAVNSGSGIGADVFSYWFAGNQNLPDALTGVAHFEFGHEHSGAGTQNDITGMDAFMPSVVEARGVSTLFMPVVDMWFFTLTPETSNHINSSAWANWQSVFACDESEIGTSYVYCSQWTPGQGWSQIDVRFGPASLGLNVGDEIDAIAYLGSDPHKIVFSLSAATAGNREEILVGGVAINQGNGGNKPLRDENGDVIPDKIGIGNETNVDSICGLDPENGNYERAWMAMPVENVLVDDIGCSAARYRTYDQSGSWVGEELLVQATSLPPNGRLVGWLVEIAGPLPGVNPVLTTLVPNSDRMEAVLSLPLGISNATITVQAIWVENVSGAPIDRSWKVRLIIP